MPQELKAPPSAIPESLAEPPAPPPPDAASRPRLSRRLASAVSVTGVGSVAVMALSSLASIVAARSGGPAGYAVFVAANMVIYTGATLGQWGLPWALAKEISADDENHRQERVRRACTSGVLLSIALAAVLALLLEATLPELARALDVRWGRLFALVLPAALLGALIADCADGVYFGLLRPIHSLTITAAGPAAMVVYLVVRQVTATHAFRLPLWGAAVSSYVSSGLVAAALLASSRLFARPLSLAELRPVFRDMLPASGFVFFTVFSVWIDRWIVAASLGAASLGLYSAAVSAVQIGLRLPTNVAYLLMPAAVRATAGSADPDDHSLAAVTRGVERRARYAGLVIRAFALCSLLVTVVLLLGGSAVVPLFFGRGFLPAVPPLLLMTPSLLASAVSIPLMLVLTGSRENYLMTPLLLVSLPVRVVLLVVLTRAGGLPGTAVATALSDWLHAGCCVVLAHRLKVGFPARALALPLGTALAALALGGAARLLGAPELVCACLGGAVFLPALWTGLRPIREAET